jgi:O-antigen ligase
MTRKWSIRILYAFLIGYIISLTLSYIQWTGYAPLSRDNLPSGFHTRIQLGTLEAFSFYICSIFLIFKTNANLRNLYITLIIITLFNLLFINTGRSGYIVFVLLLFMLQFLLWRWKGLALATLAVILGSFVLYQYSPSFHERIENTIAEITEINTNLNKENVGVRSTLWINAISIIQENPIFGSGTGSYPIEYKKISNGMDSKNPHQQFLLTWAEQGFLGLFLLLSLLYKQWQVAQTFPQPEKYLAYGFLATFIVHSLFNSSIMDNLEGHFYALMTVALWINKEDLAWPHVDTKPS